MLDEAQGRKLSVAVSLTAAAMGLLPDSLAQLTARATLNGHPRAPLIAPIHFAFRVAGDDRMPGNSVIERWDLTIAVALMVLVAALLARSLASQLHQPSMGQAPRVPRVRSSPVELDAANDDPSIEQRRRAGSDREP